MAASGARGLLKPVGSATWIASEKENITNLVNQEMEEVEFPARNEMEWLNEHMAEIFSKDQFNLTDAFKTPGKLRGKTPRTARKRNVEETRMPLSEIFSHNQMETKSNASPMDYRTVAKPFPQATEGAGKDASQPQYPDLTKNSNFFSKYNTDSGYHGMPDDAIGLALSQNQPGSQTLAQPLKNAPEARVPAAPSENSHENRTSAGHRTTGGSFYSAQENVRLRGQTAESMDIDPQEQNEEVKPQKPQLTVLEPERASSEPHEVQRMEPKPQQTEPQTKQTELESQRTEPETQFTELQSQRAEPDTQLTEPQLSEPETMESKPAGHESVPHSPMEHKKSDYKSAENEPEAYKPAVPEQVEREPRPTMSTHESTVDGRKPRESESKPSASEDAPTESQHGPTEREHKPAHEPEQKRVSESEPVSQPAPDVKTPRTNVPEAKEEQPRHGVTDSRKEDVDLDNLDDIGSPSDGSTPEPVPIRKSSLTFASLPARDPLLTKKSIGGSRISRTSHVDPIHAGRSSYLGRQIGGHRVTQSATEQNAPQTDKMDVDTERDVSRKDTNEDSRASQLHSKSSTQRLHEKISMLGKLQPSRPTKSIPSVAGLSSAQVTYPELSSTKTEPKMEVPSQKHHDALAADIMATEDEEAPHTPRRLDLSRKQNTDVEQKDIPRTVEMEDLPAIQPQSLNGDQRSRSNTIKSTRERSATPVHSIRQYHGHQQSPSVSNSASGPEQSTTPGGSPRRVEGPLSSSKFKLQSIMKSAKGLFSNSAGASVAARTGTLSPTPSRQEPHGPVKAHAADRNEEPYQGQDSSPPRQEGRRTRSFTEREEKRLQEELESRRQEEERLEKLREQDMEKQKTAQAKAAQEKSSVGQEGRAAPTHAYATLPSPKKVPQHQRQASREPEINHDAGSKHAIASVPHQQLRKPTDRRPVKPTREPTQKSQPQPVSIRVGSALSRQMPLASSGFSSSVQDSVPAPAPAQAPHLASAAKPPTIKKKASNSSLQTASSAGSLKSTFSSQSQRKAQLASERKKEQEEREAKRKEEQKRELARKRAAQQQQHQQEEARRRERERHAEDPKRAAQMQEIEKRRLMNARRLDRQGSQQPPNELHERTTQAPSQRGDLGTSRPASRLGSVQSFSRPINPPAPNPAKPPKRHLDEEAEARPAAPKSSAVQPSGESKRRKTEEEHHNPPIRPAMAPPIRQSNIRKEPSKPSIFGHGQHSVSHQAGPSIIKTAPHTGPSQAQRPANPMDMAKYTSGKIPFAEPSNPPSQQQYKAPAAPSIQKAAGKPSPKYPNGENINLPEIPTDSEDEDSESDILPVPKWAQPKELENILRQQDGMETDSIFGPVAPFSLEDTFKSDKKIKKFRDRTSSANWSGTDALTQEEIYTDLAERQRFKHNGGWSMR